MTNTELQVKHTPAPWLVEGTTVYALEHNGWRKGVEQLCNRFTASISGNPRTTSKEELIANAQLIAAAPELLEALKELMKPFNGELLSCDAYKNANAAIEKAEGKA